MAKRTPASDVRKQITQLRKGWGWTPSDIINLLRGGGSSAKGGEYEREICKRLSLWWTGNKRDDVFWRSSGSGARAKVRGRAGVQTMGQHGDVAATDPVGVPLIDLLTIEIKRGYSDNTLQDLLDVPPKGGVQEWGKWFAQATESAEQAGSCSWALITRRDRRCAMVWFPFTMLRELRSVGSFAGTKPCPFARVSVSVRGADGGTELDVAGMVLDDFLANVSPDHVKELSRSW